MSLKVLEFLWIEARPTHIAFFCGRKIRNLGSPYVLIHEESKKPEENPSREAEKVPPKSKDVGKDYFASVPQIKTTLRSPSVFSKKENGFIFLFPARLCFSYLFNASTILFFVLIFFPIV